MSQLDPDSYPPDICLLLRIHAEQRWLSSEVVPLLRQVEAPGALEEGEAGPATAYLEVLWLEARRRAAETDTAFVELDPEDGSCSSVLYARACRYHAALRRLREALDRRVTDVALPAEGMPAQEPANS